jgi:hypothetical protein
LITVDAKAIRTAEKLIESCEHCHPDDAEIPFDWVLDKVIGGSGESTDYVMSESARCPNCRCKMTEKTLVDLRDEE